MMHEHDSHKYLCIIINTDIIIKMLSYLLQRIKFRVVRTE